VRQERFFSQTKTDPGIKPLARSGSSIVRRDRKNDAALNGKVGSCAGERAAQRPRAWKIGSLS
jgi:hypothetical protein